MKVVAKINRMTVKDKDGHDVVGEPRPYQLAIQAGIFHLTSTWRSATDKESEEKAKEVFAAIAAHLQGEELCQKEVPTLPQKKKSAPKSGRNPSKRPLPTKKKKKG